jgi:dTDP-4-amino-4,6-dideoxygalactose transaminase
MRHVPYVNIGAQFREERDELMPIIEQVLAEGHHIGGAWIEKLEEKVAALSGKRYAVALNSGTDALMLGMAALGIGKGDEVITPPNSFVASTAAIVHIGAKPVFVDVAPDQNIEPALIESAITPRTRAIMPVHLTGRICDMHPILEIARRHKLLVIEDAAQSIGSRYDGRLAGSFGQIGCFSTHPLKNLSAAGDGGLVTTDDADIAAQLRLMRNHGLVDRNRVACFGFVSRMDTLQAAILHHRLGRLDRIIERRRHNADLYRRHLDPAHVFVPPCRQIEYNTFHTFVVQVDRRDELQQFLAERGIGTAIHYPIPIHVQPAAVGLGHRTGDFPITERQAGRILTLPVNQSLGDEDVVYVARAVNAFYRP